jgi:hypothetical protein
MSEQPTKPGPANPVPEGVDVPTPPGGPQRQDSVGQDEPDTGNIPGREHPEDQMDPNPGVMEPVLQEENAGTSLDQPSDNSGAE